VSAALQLNRRIRFHADAHCSVRLGACNRIVCRTCPTKQPACRKATFSWLARKRQQPTF